VYPQHRWQGWRFEKVSQGYWKQQPDDTIREFMDDLGAKLSIRTLEDWYRVSWVQLRGLGVSHTIEAIDGLHRALQRAYPHHTWQQRQISRPSKRALQKQLVAAVRALFPSHGSLP
jgi:exopolyphosphatase/pppGpp-phosphohydrolase